jgi:hypothetical protein
MAQVQNTADPATVSSKPGYLVEPASGAGPAASNMRMGKTNRAPALEGPLAITT